MTLIVECFCYTPQKYNLFTDYANKKRMSHPHPHRTILCIALLLVTMTAAAWDTDYRLSARVGWIMPDGKVDKITNQSGKWVGPVYGADFSVTFHPQWTALQAWNNAGVGVGLSYWYLSQPILGHAIAPYIYMDVPIVKRPHFILGIRPALGAAFMTSTYRNTVPEGHLFKDLNDANQCVGSVTNFYFPEALYMDFPIAHGWSVMLGGGWYHISNGSTRQPNSGYNIFSAEVGVRYEIEQEDPINPKAHTIKRLHTADTTQLRPWEVEISFAGGGRQVYYRDQQTFFVAEMQAAAYWRAHEIFRLGGGVDVFYDGAYIPRETYFRKTNYAAASADGKDCWRVGLSIQPEFVVGHLTAGLHIGAYLYDPVKELEPYDEAVKSPSGRISKPIFYKYDLLKAGSAGYPDGWLYTQVVLRYRLPYHIFLQAAIKSHLTKVEFVAVGIGAYY